MSCALANHIGYITLRWTKVEVRRELLTQGIRAVLCASLMRSSPHFSSMVRRADIPPRPERSEPREAGDCAARPAHQGTVTFLDEPASVGADMATVAADNLVRRCPGSQES